MKEQSVFAYCEAGWTVFSSDNSTGVEFLKYSSGIVYRSPSSHFNCSKPISSFMADYKPKSTRFTKDRDEDLQIPGVAKI